MGQSVLITSRRAKPESPTTPFKDFRIVQFDWHDDSTFMKPFSYISYHRTELGEDISPIDRVLLIVPISMNMLDHMRPFVESAMRQGVKRFVLVSATPARKGEPGLGKVHEYIENLGMEWCVLRPSWFMENFATNYRAVPFVSIDDVVPVACQALLAKKSLNREQIIVGPELLSYNQAASIFSRVLNRPITHRRETAMEHAKLYKMVGLGEVDADLLTRYDTSVARGSDEEVFADCRISGCGRNREKNMLIRKGVPSTPSLESFMS
ncbi:hypothetical protein NP233_g11938 [Leucocoprinus birnbaumii]|uniref:Agroclavine dehydrogenase n=1 Tax=Leucocoprinus birnbaumii TaxID=56174 RepID=A0AAD5YJX0_9AGAR|nr:hypothetical protein NP233_g11938 [Leucocoprinus birnbaumii]